MKPLASTRAGQLIVGLSLILGACGGDSGSESASGAQRDQPKAAIKIGFIGPLSGDNANAASDMLNAARLAVDEINAGGGVLGRPLEIVSADDACDPQTGTAAAPLVARRIFATIAEISAAGTACSWSSRTSPRRSASPTAPTCSRRDAWSSPARGRSLAADPASRPPTSG